MNEQNAPTTPHPVLVAISAGSASRDAPSLFQAGGTVLVLASAVIFLIVSLGEGLRYERLLRDTLDVLGFNQRILGRRRALSSVGLLCLATGTMLIGARVTALQL